MCIFTSASAKCVSGLFKITETEIIHNLLGYADLSPSNICETIAVLNDFGDHRTMLYAKIMPSVRENVSVNNFHTGHYQKFAMVSHLLLLNTWSKSTKLKIAVILDHIPFLPISGSMEQPFHNVLVIE